MTAKSINVSVKKAYHLSAGLICVLFVVFSFYVVSDYGIAWDSPENFGIGHKYLYYYQTGHLDFMDDLPALEGHPGYYNHFVKEVPYQLWPLANVAAAAGYELFYRQWGLLDPVAAHHAVIPLFSLLLLAGVYLFLQRHAGGWVALVSCLLIATYPQFWGHSFNNIKDIPQVALFSLTLLALAHWALSGRLRWFYAGAVLLALALATKMDAVFVPVIFVLWQLPRFCKWIRQDEHFRLRMLLHFVAGGVALGLIFILFFPPLYPSRPGNVAFAESMFNYIKYFSKDPRITWNLYAPSQILYVTPLWLLPFFAIGLIHAFRRAVKEPLMYLLLLWFFIPVMRHCLPGMGHYDGVRHFLVYVAPLNILAGLGILSFTGFMANRFGWRQERIGVLAAGAGLTMNIFTLVVMHPYQTAFYNQIAGGLAGAQQKGIPFAADYWLNSYREAGAWLDANAAENARYYAWPYPELLPYHVSRPDLTRLENLEDIRLAPTNTYIVVVPRREIRVGRPMWRLDEFVDDNPWPVVHRITRQGGDIATIHAVTGTE